MAERLTDDDRNEIIELLENSNLTRNTIAKRTNRSPDTVSRVAASIGHVFGQTNRKNAQARRAYCAEERSRLQVRLLTEAHALMDTLHAPHTAFNFGGKDNDYNSKEFPEPDVKAKQSILTSVAICVDKSELIEKNSNGDNDGKGAMVELFEALGIKMKAPSTPAPEVDDGDE